MTFREYQDKAWDTALPTTKNLSYMTLGLTNEAGEVAGKIKKIIRGDAVNPRDVGKEVGDVLWYLACLCTVYDMNLEFIAQENLEKLQDRKERGKLQGNGDDR